MMEKRGIIEEGLTPEQPVVETPKCGCTGKCKQKNAKAPAPEERLDSDITGALADAAEGKRTK